MKRYWLLVFVFAVVLFLYYPVFSVYFSHDDFFFIAEDWGGTSKQVAFILNREDAFSFFTKTGH